MRLRTQRTIGGAAGKSDGASLLMCRQGSVDVETWEAERDQMLDLAERFTVLDDDQWNSPSLCAQWRIRDVLGHVTAGAEGVFRFGAIFRGMLRHGFNYNRWIAADGQVRGQQDPAILLKALRNAAVNPIAPPGTRSVRGLMHVLVHGQDMCRPLGIARNLPEAHLVPVADFVKDDVHIFGAKKRIAGLRLTATDMDWSHGNGPEVTGPAEALVMVMAGRLVALDDLSGEGKAALVLDTRPLPPGKGCREPAARRWNRKATGWSLTSARRRGARDPAHP